jgi:hypothetical protein
MKLADVQHCFSLLSLYVTGVADSVVPDSRPELTRHPQREVLTT